MLYRAVIAARNMLYDTGVFRVARLPVPVIAVGNISAGGTGKTPLAAAIAAHALARGCRVAFVTRGYGRRTRGTVVVSDGAGTLAHWRDGGDEPVMVARALPALPVVADERRARGCRVAVERFGADLLVLDDAFQHRACGRDVDIVAVDAARDPYTDRLLPFGRLREPVSSLRRAHAVVLTRWRDAPAWHAAEAQLRAELACPVERALYEVSALREAGGGTRKPESLAGVVVAAFCGIGAPAAFVRTLEDLGARVADCIDHPDHHEYSDDDIRNIGARARAAGASALVTTAKDAVRMEDRAALAGGLPLLVLEMRAELPADGAVLACIDAAIDEHRRKT